MTTTKPSVTSALTEKWEERLKTQQDSRAKRKEETAAKIAKMNEMTRVIQAAREVQRKKLCEDSRLNIAKT